MSMFEFDDQRHVGRLAGTLHSPGGTPGDVPTVQADGSLALKPVGGGAAPNLEVLSFAFGTAGLTNGVPVYTPKIGEWLLDAWIYLPTPWDVTPALADIGRNAGLGLFANYANAAVDISSQGNTWADDAAGFGFGNATGFDLLAGIALNDLPSGFGTYPPRFRFSTADPLLVWVSSDGSRGGADPGAGAGQATAVVLIGRA